MGEQCPDFMVANTISHRGRRSEDCLGVVCGRYNECHGINGVVKVIRVRKIRRHRRRR